jgi:hypothetical protein
MPRQFKIVIADRIKGGKDNFHAPARESAYHKIILYHKKSISFEFRKIL